MAMPKSRDREFAIEIGLATYYTGKLCKSGHQSSRYTADSSCVACRDEFRKGRHETAAAQMRVKREILLYIDPEGTRALGNSQARARRLRNPEKVRALDRKHGRLKRQRNPAGKLAEVRRRQCAKLQRTPPWADLQAIKAFYEARPPGMEVDHVIPLRGKTVSGLHVVENLQYLTPPENLAKGNRF